jgi:hypothetical protein
VITIAISNGYTTLAALKARIDARGSTITDATRDATLEAVITAASRAIDGETGRAFYTVTETRRFTAESTSRVLIDDLITSSAVTADGTAVAVEAWPFNGTPKTRLYAGDGVSFPTTRAGITVTGTWGYASAVPEAIAEACLLLAARFYGRKDAPLGVVAGSDETGVIRIMARDPDVRALLAPYRRVALCR